MNVILSIKPDFANAILSGEKRVEFRKVLFKEEVENIFIYSSSPQKKIIGSFTFSEIIEDTPGNLWEKFGEVGFINKEDFFKYFKNKETGYAIFIDSVYRLMDEIDPYKIFEKFVPPQSFRYCDETTNLTGNLDKREYSFRA